MTGVQTCALPILLRTEVLSRLSRYPAANVQMESPALSTGGGRAVAYDVGGRELYVLDAEGLVSELRAEEEEPFIAASLNEKGWMAVTASRRSA